MAEEDLNVFVNIGPEEAKLENEVVLQQTNKAGILTLGGVAISYTTTGVPFLVATKDWSNKEKEFFLTWIIKFALMEEPLFLYIPDSGDSSNV